MTIQRTLWTWNGSKWTTADSDRDNPPMPSYKGKKVGETAGAATATASREASYDAAETLTNGTVIDWPALVAVMQNVTKGTDVASSVWRAMREKLSNAITLANKSHPPHGSNFDRKQRPEQQIIDWAKVIQGELKTKLTAFFRAKYEIYL